MVPLFDMATEVRVPVKVGEAESTKFPVPVELVTSEIDATRLARVMVEVKFFEPSVATRREAVRPVTLRVPIVAEGVPSAPVEEIVVEPVPPKLAVFAVMRPVKRLVEEALVRVVLPFKMVAPFAVKPEVNVWRLLQVFVVVVPNARLKTFELICSG